MRFDDRLATVLGQPAVDSHGRAVQWRQLVELVARGGGEASPALRDPALERIAELMDEVSSDLLAATSRAIAGPRVPAELVALFAARGAAASAALVTAAELDPAGWTAVRTVATPDVLALIGQSAAPAAAAPDAPVTPAAPSEPLPAGLFRWECGPTGEIDWIEGAPRAALIGRSLTEPFADRFAARLPFSDEPLVLAEEGELSGEWQWTGTPVFFPDTGRFAGYRGFARRDGAEPAPLPAAAALPQDDDLRELVHELRTPLNAIIGFGEIIEGQYLGPAHRAYRARAAIIVREARRLSDAVDTLDLAARLRSGRLTGDTRTELSAIQVTLDRLAEDASKQGIRLTIENRLTRATLALPPQLAERLVHQLADFLVDVAEPGERLGVVIDRIDGQAAIALDRPRLLAGLDEEQLLGGAQLPGARFPLRLVQGLASMIAGRLDIAAGRLVLLLPLVRE